MRGLTIAAAGLLTSALASGAVSPFAAASLAVAAPTPVVAIVDSGVDGSVLATTPVQEWTCSAAGCIRAAEPGQTDSEHGTAVASVLTRDAPGVAYWSYRVTTPYGLVSIPALRAAVVAAADAGVPVVNLSMVTFGRDPVLVRTIRSHPATLFVTAAGNQGREVDQEHPVSPCIVAAPNVVCVAASTDAGALWAGSNWSARHVDLATAGVRVPTYAGPYGSRSATGTSIAAPAVAAAAARIVRNVDCRSAAVVAHAVIATVTRTEALAGSVASGGTLNADAAVSYARRRCGAASG